MNKLLYLIRHGYALHNELFLKIGIKAFQSPIVYDSPLTQHGHVQSVQLGQSWDKKYDIELILVSPLTRALDTCMNIFGDTDIPIECHEFLREYPIGEDTCNKRSSLTEIKNKYPKIDFHLSMDDDHLWIQNYRETLPQLENRINEMIQYIQTRKETNIAIISHSSYLGQFKDNHIGYMENGDEELKHCYPYEFILTSDYKRSE
jgi:broad specificity phosphatase PhoE